MEPPYAPAIPFLGIFPKELEYHSNTYILIAAQSTVAKLWNQPRCPSTDELIKKMWYIHTMDFYSGTEKNKIMSFAGKWTDLENIMLSEISLSQKVKGCMFSLIYGS